MDHQRPENRHRGALSGSGAAAAFGHATSIAATIAAASSSEGVGEISTLIADAGRP